MAILDFLGDGAMKSEMERALPESVVDLEVLKNGLLPVYLCKCCNVIG